MSAWSAPAPISDADLHRLGERMCCDFTSAPRRSYLDRWVDCDVQAAPGSGKTTLLVAKLVHLARNWPFKHQGVCVLSHTNVARHEIEGRIARFPDAARLLAYPNFVGTLTTFFHTFLALPLLRGLGWGVTCIDDDIFAARALSKAYGKGTLRRTLRGRGGRQVESWLAHLNLAEDFSLTGGPAPTQLSVAQQPRLPSSGTASRVELEEVKAELAIAGVYRYADMLVLARRALQLVPELATRLAARFPLVILDEAQDTSAVHLDLIERVFGDGRSAVQRIGDCNQAILVGDEPGAVSWTPARGHIDLGESLRFGPGIAKLASRVTCHLEQTIEGNASTEDWPPQVLLVPSGSEKRVGRHFADLVAAKFASSVAPDVWAVGWTHTPSDSQSAVRLGTYFGSYEPPQRSATVGKTLLGAVQDELAKLPATDRLDLAATVDAYARQMRILLAGHLPWSKLPSIARIWRWLDEMRPGAAREARSVLLHIIQLNGRPSASEWAVLAGRIRDSLDPALPRAANIRAVDDQLAFVMVGAANPVAPTARGRSETYDIAGRQIRVRLGTIASVKGRTHDATLVVETTSGNVRDLCWALEMATGHVSRGDFEAKPKVRSAVMNVFVAATRPRHLLCLALGKDPRSEKLRTKLEAQGIIVSDLP